MSHLAIVCYALMNNLQFLDQHYSIELSRMMAIFSVVAVQYGVY